MDINLTIAYNAKKAREEKKLTLDAAAALTGVSRSMLAQIEKGDVNPTISVLWKIANGYKVSFSTLVEDSRKESFVVPCREPMTADDGRYLNYPTFPFDEQRLFEMYRIVIKPNGQMQAQAHLASSEEYVTVFSGTVQIVLPDAKHVLSVGDSLRFQADQAHSYWNIGADQAELSMLIYYAS